MSQTSRDRVNARRVRTHEKNSGDAVRRLGTIIEYRSDDGIKMKFVKLWDLLRYSERTTFKTPTRQKLAIRAKLSLRY